MSATNRIPAPTDFLWGTAISAHQSEGGNVNSDAWLCETSTPTVYRQPSRDACDSYHRFAEDIAIAADLGFNCHRIGIEWARIEPDQGFFSTAELDHYRRVLEACHERGLTPMVTFNHFTAPRWFAARGGFEVAEGADLFARFAERATDRLGDLIGYASTFNEANIQRLLALAYGGVNHPRVHEMLAACAKACGSDRFSSLLFAPYERTEAVLIDAHRKATAAMKAGPGNFPVGITLTMQDIQSPGDEQAAVAGRERLYGPWLEEGKQADFVGVQTYTRYTVDASGKIVAPSGVELTGAGYEFYPEALGATIRFAHEQCSRPIFVTESGICTDDDTRRVAYLDAALTEVRKCIADGIAIHSYICWSLLDNFEWTRGYGERFGLVHVDYETFARTPKPSAYWLGERARSSQI